MYSCLCSLSLPTPLLWTITHHKKDSIIYFLEYACCSEYQNSIICNQISQTCKSLASFQHFSIVSPLDLFHIHRNLWWPRSLPDPVFQYTLTGWPRMDREHRIRAGEKIFPKSYNHYGELHSSQITPSVLFASVVVCGPCMYCVYKCCLCTCRCQRSMLGFFLITFHLIFWDRVSSLNLDFTTWSVSSRDLAVSAHTPHNKVTGDAITPASPLPAQLCDD